MKKEFFKIAATVLLLPGGMLLTAAVAVLLAILLAAMIYGALIFCGLRWILRRAGTLLFGKAAPVHTAASLPQGLNLVTTPAVRIPTAAELAKGVNELNTSDPRNPAPNPFVERAHAEAYWKQREAAHRKWLQ